ncbi:hypothetical protein V5738_18210 [Salinisphaera sp. SPP-AMP-43]|uniref:PEP-CTERM sorting domain-containing protein n=1 Tax=Salinisphaera sp. SPP-AMP-43 TaxID=3121288 RepID=UPI003C6DD6B3
MSKPAFIPWLRLPGLKTGLALGLTLAAMSAQAAVIGADTDVFQDDRSAIDFSGLTTGTVDPVYSAAPGANAPTVSFGSYFEGQSLATDGACAAYSCFNGNPTAGLALNAAADPVFSANANNAPNNPVLSGSPATLGPISILFSTDQAAVGVSVGYAQALGAERVTAFGRDGSILASIVNDSIGFSFLTLASDEASAEIAGIQITRTGETDSGFVLDSLLFGGPEQVNATRPTPPPASVPAPGNLALFAFALGLVLIARRRARDPAC